MTTRLAENFVTLDVPLDFEIPDLSEEGLDVAPTGELDLVATYFDTADLRLLRGGITLHHRQDLAIDGQDWWRLTIAPGSGSGALERHDLSWPGGHAEVPEEAVRLVRALTREHLLERVAELVTRRRRFEIEGPDGRRLGELDDDLVSATLRTRVGPTFRRIEVELEDEYLLAGAVASKLEGAGAVPGDEQPPLVRAVGDPSGEPPLDPPLVLGPTALMEDVVRAALADGLERLSRHDVAVRLAGGPESVHQARVAARRLRSDLQTLAPLLDPAWVEATRDELAWLGRALGAVRDLDVLASRLADDAVGTAAIDAGAVADLAATLDADWQQAMGDLQEAYASSRYFALLATLTRAAERPPFAAAGQDGPGVEGLSAADLVPGAPAAAVLPALVRRGWHRARTAARHVAAEPTDHHLHRLRIRAKQLRYAAELATPVVGDDARRTARAAERLQEVLGRHHDAVATEAWLRSVADQGSPERAVAAGEMVAAERARQARQRARWERAYQRLERGGRLAWLA